MPPPSRWDGLWSASHDLQHFPLESFVDNGLNVIPVAITPSDGSALPARNPRALTSLLEGITPDFHDILEVRRYGSGIICKSANLPVVRKLLTCTQFGPSLVKSTIPPHLACTKGVVRGVDASLRADEVLDLFKHLGVTEVFRCSRTENGYRKPTESMIVTFAGHKLPCEIKAWPVIFRVEPFQSRPLQCRNCFRFGHSVKYCKSSARCRLCSGDHQEGACQTSESKCCLCGDAHHADSADCPVREQEFTILERMDQRHCSRREAIASLPSVSYATKTQPRTPQSSLHHPNEIKEILSQFKEDLKDILSSFVTSLTTAATLLASNMQTSVDMDFEAAPTAEAIALGAPLDPSPCDPPPPDTTPATLSDCDRPVLTPGDVPTFSSTHSSSILRNQKRPSPSLQTVSFKANAVAPSKGKKKKKEDILAAAVAASITGND